ncbi:hypothetical protein E2C01_022587 [Portunus trituberculatus]|uniref:Uncharacterized protein n=1 Tax=Portunus trituberculatus TaxID=210409 RepID=A0A5B7E7H2_PORTR|nr:hypothetical protein [Portunus trituberculatus]
MYSTRTGCVKPRFRRFRLRKRMRNVHLHADTITSVMHSTHRDRSLTRKQ